MRLLRSISVEAQNNTTVTMEKGMEDQGWPNIEGDRWISWCIVHHLWEAEQNFVRSEHTSIWINGTQWLARERQVQVIDHSKQMRNAAYQDGARRGLESPGRSQCSIGRKAVELEHERIYNPIKNVSILHHGDHHT